MTNTSNFLSPQEITAYGARRLAANTGYSTSKSVNNYQRSLDINKFGTDQTALNRSWDRAYNNLSGGYAKRGILNSGIYANAGTDYGIDRSSALSNFARDYQGRQQGFDLNDRNLTNVHDSTMNSINADQAASQAERAATIRGA